MGILKDATRENAAIAAGPDADREMDRAAAALINGIIAGEKAPDPH